MGKLLLIKREKKKTKRSSKRRARSRRAGEPKKECYSRYLVRFKNRKSFSVERYGGMQHHLGRGRDAAWTLGRGKHILGGGFGKVRGSINWGVPFHKRKREGMNPQEGENIR